MDIKAVKAAGAMASPQNSAEQAAQVAAVPEKEPEPAAKAATPTPEAVEHTAEQVRQRMAAVAEQLREFARAASRNLEFRVDEQSHRTVITVRNAATGEVVRQIPDEELLELQRRMNAGYGTLVDYLV